MTIVKSKSGSGHGGVVVVLFLGLVLAGCLKSDEPTCERENTTNGYDEAARSLTISDNGWSPSRLVGEVNETFNIQNAGGERVVCVTAPDSSVVRAALIQNGESMTVMFDRPGNYTAHDSLTLEEAYLEVVWKLRFPPHPPN